MKHIYSILLKRLKKFFNPHHFINSSPKIIKYLSFILLAELPYNILLILNSPIDYQQGIMVKLMYLHVPSAWLSLILYTFLAGFTIINLIYRIRIAFFMAIASAEIGSVFAFITLLTGSFWGKPIWGSWWVWDGRLTSMLILFLLYLSYLIVVYSGENNSRIERPCGAIAILGFVNIPIVKFSVLLWSTLHQQSSIFRNTGPAIHPKMLLPLVISFLTLVIYTTVLFILRTNILIANYKFKTDREDYKYQ